MKSFTLLAISALSITLWPSDSRASLVCNSSLSSCGSSSSPALTINDFHNPSVAISISAANIGILATSTSSNGIYADSSGNWVSAAYGETSSCSGAGIIGRHTGSNCANSGAGVFGDAYSASSWTGYFTGNVVVTGSLTAASKNFMIDHPLDPENKYLLHTLVESSEPENIYDGVVTLDKGGKARVQMPAWFNAINARFNYHLTTIGSFAPVYVSRVLENGVFEISGGTRGLRVSWQVAAARNDAWTRAHPFKNEPDKSPHEIGRYLHPREHGVPEALGLLKPSFVSTPSVKAAASMKREVRQ